MTPNDEDGPRPPEFVPVVEDEKQPDSLSRSDSTMAWSSSLPELGPPISPRFRGSVEIQQYRGPFPPPNMIAEYERVLPGLGREIMDGFTEERKHRHQLQSRRAHADIEVERRGQWFAFILSLAFAGVAVFAFHRGHPTSAAIVVGVNLVALAALFISGKKPKQPDDT